MKIAYPITLVGVPLLEVPEAFARVLSPKAYKGIPYSKVKDSDGKTRELTDINPAYFIEAMNKVFGPAGYGWWYEFDEMTADYDPNAFSNKGGWNITISNLRLYYHFKLDDSDEVLSSDGIVASGVAFMHNRSHAERGAIANALGSAGAKLGWQNYVYKGIVNHENVIEALKRQDESDKSLPRIPGTPLK